MPAASLSELASCPSDAPLPLQVVEDPAEFDVVEFWHGLDVTPRPLQKHLARLGGAS